MSIYVRADFDFNDEKNGIKHCTGYVVCKDVHIQENGGYTFGVHSVIIKKLIAKKPDFDKINAMAINHCKLFDDVIKVGSLADYHDKTKSPERGKGAIYDKK